MHGSVLLRRFRPLPERFHLVEARFLEAAAAFLERALDSMQARAEFLVGAAQGFLRVDPQVPAEIDQREQHVAELVLDISGFAFAPSPRAARRSPPRSCRGWASPPSSRSRPSPPSPAASARG